MSRNVFTIENGKFGLSLTDPGVGAGAATVSDYTDFSCQVTTGALNATPNVSTNDVPATWCEPASSTPLVGVTTYELALSFLQDPNVVAGLSRFLFEHDTKVAYWFMGLDGDNPPKAVGKLRVVAGTIGGEARVSLTADVTLPVDGKPEIAFGNSTGSEVVGGKVQVALGAVITDAEVAGAVGSTVKLDLINTKYEPVAGPWATTGDKATIGATDVHADSASTFASGAAL